MPRTSLVGRLHSGFLLRPRCPGALELLLGGRENFVPSWIAHKVMSGAASHEQLLFPEWPVPDWITRRENADDRNTQSVSNVHRPTVVADEHIATGHQCHHLAQ